MWQVSIATGAEGEEAVGQLLERTLSQAPSVFRDEKTGGIVVTSYPKRLPRPRRALHVALKEGLADLRQFGLDPSPGRISIQPLPRRNWSESWKRHFKPIDIQGKLLLKPSWSRRRPIPGQRVVILDPGLSFGTGHHPTTLYCLEQLVCCRKPGPAQSCLDIGTGSGILAIAAAKLGYGPVVAFDFDPESLRVSRQNVKRNKVKIRLGRGELGRMPQWARGQYDFVCANLACDLLLAQVKVLCQVLKPGGKLVVAGILGREFAKIRQKFSESNLTFEKTRVRREWKSGRIAHLPAGSASHRSSAAKE
ncbi:MAG: 50S ribosomal protein L11 methyltransferase [Limisphaerales bacterium]